MSSLFTKIIKGEIPGFIIAKNQYAAAFLDIQPLAEGHTLVVPVKEAATILELDDKDLEQLALTIKAVTAILHKSLKPAGFTIGINQGAGAGQLIEHLHVHIIPRYKNDGGGTLHSLIKNPPKISVEKIYKKINATLR